MKRSGIIFGLMLWSVCLAAGADASPKIDPGLHDACLSAEDITWEKVEQYAFDHDLPLISYEERMQQREEFYASVASANTRAASDMPRLRAAVLNKYDAWWLDDKKNARLVFKVASSDWGMASDKFESFADMQTSCSISGLMSRRDVLRLLGAIEFEVASLSVDPEGNFVSMFFGNIGEIYGPGLGSATFAPEVLFENRKICQRGEIPPGGACSGKIIAGRSFSGPKISADDLKVIEEVLEEEVKVEWSRTVIEFTSPNMKPIEIFKETIDPSDEYRTYKPNDRK